MPLRGLFYLAAEYQRLVSEQEMDIYRKSLLMLPLPRYIVLCNASEMKEEKSILRLSDAYGIKGEASLEYLKGFSDCKQGQGDRDDT